jgi:hypothetical protein
VLRGRYPADLLLLFYSILQRASEKTLMFHYFKGRRLTHLGCALGVSLGLMIGLIVGGALSVSHPLSVAVWVMVGVTVAVGAAGWVVGALFSPKPETK